MPEETRNGNGNRLRNGLYLLLAASLLAFIGFTLDAIYIETPKCYATKQEVQELKSDVNDDIKYIRGRLDDIWGAMP